MPRRRNQLKKKSHHLEEEMEERKNPSATEVVKIAVGKVVVGGENVHIIYLMIVVCEALASAKIFCIQPCLWSYNISTYFIIII
mmetsp:Transcript_27271/g.40713  ORF Transcript_27271/g.40713 Transcript_27271/m.40713 type:complete len:84 (+) Transcript_27271:637-888(+)